MNNALLFKGRDVREDLSLSETIVMMTMITNAIILMMSNGCIAVFLSFFQRQTRHVWKRESPGNKGITIFLQEQNTVNHRWLRNWMYLPKNVSQKSKVSLAWEIVMQCTQTQCNYCDIQLHFQLYRQYKLRYVQ